jgi:F-type H+-transporting ATPase subunit gamma
VGTLSDSLELLRRKIDGASELESVVRTMMALAASSIVQYERDDPCEWPYP